jgi:hypothetical protein
MQTLYIVVYGKEWEDMMYFTSFDKALIKLAMQSIVINGFVPTMYEFNEGPDGVYGQTKHFWCMDQEKLTNLGLTKDVAYRKIELVVGCIKQES